MSTELEQKFDIIVDWVFRDIAVNIFSNSDIWKDKNTTKPELVCNKVVTLGESNLGSLQLICAGIETFGRVWMGYKNRDWVSGEAFKSFIKDFFPKKCEPPRAPARGFILIQAELAHYLLLPAS